MTACSSKLQHLSYVTEAAWAESSTSATGAVTIPITAMIDASQLGRKMIDPGRVTQFRNERPKMIPGTFDGVEFAMEFECVGPRVGDLGARRRSRPTSRSWRG
jgi:hypothetical protein